MTYLVFAVPHDQDAVLGGMADCVGVYTAIDEALTQLAAFLLDDPSSSYDASLWAVRGSRAQRIDWGW